MIFGQKLDFLEFFKVCGILNFLAEEIVVLSSSFLFYAAYAGHGTLCTSIGFNFAIIDNGSWIPLFSTYFSICSMLHTRVSPMQTSRYRTQGKTFYTRFCVQFQNSFYKRICLPSSTCKYFKSISEMTFEIMLMIVPRSFTRYG